MARRLGNHFPEIQKGCRKLVWIHAVSVGETKAIIPLAKLLKVEYKDVLILISNVTETGHAEAKASLPFADYHVYLPFDFSWIIRPIIRRTAPDLVILSESDFWFNMLDEAKKRGALLVLINGKISEGSLRLFSKISFLTSALFNLLDLMCIQNEHYRQRFAQLTDPKKLVVTGNIKLDAGYTPLTVGQRLSWKKALGIQEEDRVLVIGSTHDPEEKLFVHHLIELWKTFPRLKAILVPRHPERFNEVAVLLSKMAVPFRKLSDLEGWGSHSHEKMILIDKMGILRKCYEIADIACVGGSWTPTVGGHNILEPAWSGVPIVFGPYMHGQPELVELAAAYGCGIQVGEDQLGGTLNVLLTQDDKRESIGSLGLKLVSEMRGATNKTKKALDSLLDASKAGW